MSIFFAKPSNNNAGVRSKPTPPSLPLYIGGILVQLAGLAAVSFQLGDMTFLYLTGGLTIAGAITSYIMRKRGTSPRLLKLGTFLIGLIFLYVLRGAGFFGVALPAELQGGTQEILLVSALAFCATFATFLWLSDEAVVFACVWAIAMIGLTGTINVNRELILCFIAFLAAAVFVLIHQNTLSQSAGLTSLEGAAQDAVPVLRGRGGVIRAQVIAAVIAWVGSLILGFIIAIPVQMVGKNLSLASVIQKLRVPPSAVNRRTSRPRLSFNSLQNFMVGIGPVDDDPTELLYVLSEGPHYWRGRSFDIYNGHGWETSVPSAGAQIAPVVLTPDKEDLLTFNLPPLGEPRAQTNRYTHRYRFATGGGAGPLYHAAEPHQVRVGTDAIYRREDNTIGASRIIGDEYEITSDIAIPTERQLRASKAQYPEDIRVRYLSQGANNDALAALLQEALAGTPARTPYDKAQAIRRFIANRCVYTREARAVPADRDAVDFFLNESKEGYCDLYATSMTVLCRYAGIPARVATGFAPGNVAPSDLRGIQKLTTAPGDTRQWYVLRGSDMHAWCEVYFAGYGWIPYDATIDTSATNIPQATPQPIKKSPNWAELLRRGMVPLILIGLGFLGLLYVAVNELWARLGGKRKAGGATRTAVNADSLSRSYYKTARLLGRRGTHLRSALTPGEYLETVRNEMGNGVADAFSPLIRALEAASYSPDAVSDEQLRQAKGANKAVRTALRDVPRRSAPSVSQDTAHANNS